MLVGTAVGLPMSVPEATMSRPAIIQTGPAASNQFRPACGPCATLISSPLRNPTMSPSRAYSRVTALEPAAPAVGAPKWNSG